MDKLPFCSVPYIHAFSKVEMNFRNCCAAFPQVISKDYDFEKWWTGDDMENFRNRISAGWIDECKHCERSEAVTGKSFRTAVNNTVENVETLGVWPQRWQIAFGNTCNLACWSCDENSSSTIEAHKKKAGILPADFVDINKKFSEHWGDTKKNVLKSYDHYDTVVLTILGGEPMINKDVQDFLMELDSMGYAPRTRIEFHTNATKFNEALFTPQWQYVCVFLSIDAIGKKLEWLRYGAKWDVVDRNVDLFKSVCSYTEIHCVLSVLNIMDLPALREYCDEKDLDIRIYTVVDPEMMSLARWDGDPADLVDRESLGDFKEYYDLIGKNPTNAREQLDNYIEKFSGFRRSLKDFDPHLHNLIKSYKPID